MSLNDGEEQSGSGAPSSFSEALRTPTAQDPTSALVESAAVGPLTASIVQIYGPAIGRRHLLTEPVVIGRETTADVLLDLPGVSRRHARLFERDGSWRVEDLGSTNGTFLGASEVRGERILSSGDVLRIGGAIFKFLAGGDIEALYHEEIYHLTITDGLTGIPNKRHFTELLQREAMRARRRGRSLWVVMLDIDHFKHLNDDYGHVVGDRILHELATLLAAEVRADEAVSRFGGEEFIFMLPEADADEVKRFCERVRTLIAAHEFCFDEEAHHLTVSLGASRLLPDQSVDDLVRAADDQLYRAKRAGRNQAFVENPEIGEAP